MPSTAAFGYLMWRPRTKRNKLGRPVINSFSCPGSFPLPFTRFPLRAFSPMASPMATPMARGGCAAWPVCPSRESGFACFFSTVVIAALCVFPWPPGGESKWPRRTCPC